MPSHRTDGGKWRKWRFRTYFIRDSVSDLICECNNEGNIIKYTVFARQSISRRVLSMHNEPVDEEGLEISYLYLDIVSIVHLISSGSRCMGSSHG